MSDYPIVDSPTDALLTSFARNGSGAQISSRAERRRQ